MKSLNNGPVFLPYEMSEAKRSEIVAELAWIEEDLKRRRSKLNYWTVRKRDAETLPDIPQELRDAAFEYYEKAVQLVAAGEALRNYLLLMLREQPEYAPAYHYTQ